jgi:hypothetical protein
MEPLLLLLGGILISVVLFVLFRAFVLWYWRVEEILATLKSIDGKLGVLANDVPVRGKFQYSFLESIDKKLGKLSDEKNSQA